MYISYLESISPESKHYITSYCALNRGLCISPDKNARMFGNVKQSQSAAGWMLPGLRMNKENADEE